MMGDDRSGAHQIDASARADRNLLFGIIALQTNVITREQLVAAFDAWVQDKSLTLAELLERQRALPSAERQVIEKLVGLFIQKHGGDAEKSLAALSSVPQVCAELERLNDPDLDATLVYVGRDLPAQADFSSLERVTGGHSTTRFRILRPHAKGGLGQVSVALDQELNREVALKEIQPQHADQQASRERFILEAEITGGLEHPGIVPVYALGHGPDGRPFYAMRFVKGDSLKQAIEAYHEPDSSRQKDSGRRVLELRRLLARFIDVCNAMEYAHSRGVLHRDLKPGNIMVGKYGETLVVDWGLAKSGGKKEIVSDETTLRPASALSNSSETQAGAPIGTPAYMSPEQAAGRLEDLGPASDVYSLGATLYHLLCGRPPFEKEDLPAILAKVQRGDFRTPRSIAKDIPAALEAICLKAVALQSVDRYQTARSLADDVEHWLADEPVTAAPDSLRDRIGRFGRKHRGYVRAGVVASILIAAVSLAAALMIHEQSRKNSQLADEKSKLADDERDARMGAERQLRIATAERLAALSHSKRSESPEAGIVLAVESGRATRSAGENLLPSSYQALLDALAGIGGHPLIGHRQGVKCVAIGPGARWIVTGSEDCTARLWDLTIVNSAAGSRVLNGHQGTIWDVKISDNNRWIVTGSEDQTARVWNLRKIDPSDTPLILAAHSARIQCVAISPDSRWVVTGSDDKTARIWDLTANNPAASPRTLIGHQDGITSVAFSPDSRWVVTGSSDATARVWDLAADNPAADPRILTGHQGLIASVAFSPDSRRIVTGSLDSTARVWDLNAAMPSDNPQVLIGHSEMVLGVTVSPDGRWVVTGSEDRTARVWDLTAVNPAASPRILAGHYSGITCVAVSPDCRSIVTGSWDKTARVWDLNEGSSVSTPRVLAGHQAVIGCIAISPDNRWVVTGSGDATARICDLTAENPVANPQMPMRHQAAVDCIAISPDGFWIVTASRDATARAWNTKTHSTHILTGHAASIDDVAISSDNRWVVTGSDDHTARVWDLMADDPTANPRILSGHKARIACVAVSPDNHWIVTGSEDMTAQVWDLTSEDPSAAPRILAGHQAGLIDVAFSPDSRLVVTGSGDATSRVWDLSAENPAAPPRILTGHQAGITSVAFSPDGCWLITGSDDHTAQAWNLAVSFSADHPRVLSGHTDRVWRVAISPDCRWAVTGSWDNTARVWDLKAENPADNPRVLSGHQHGISCVAVSPDSRWIVTGSGDNTARVWDLAAENSNEIPRVLTGHQGQVKSVVFSTDNRWIITGSIDKTVRVWLWQWDDLESLAGQVGRNFNRAEWKLFFPNQSYRKTFQDLPIPGGD